MHTFTATKDGRHLFSGTEQDLVSSTPFPGQLVVLDAIDRITLAMTNAASDESREDARGTIVTTAFGRRIHVVAVDARELAASLDAAAFCAPGAPDEWPAIAASLRAGRCPEDFPIHHWGVSLRRYLSNMAAIATGGNV